MKTEKILVIKHRHLGDVLLSGPVFSNLRREFPQADIDAYIWKEAHPVLEGHPAIDGFLLYDRKWKELPLRKRLLKEFSMLRKIREKGYDLVVNLTEGDRGAIAARVSGAGVAVGVKPKNRWMQKGLTHVVKPCPTDRHTVERDLDALRKIGIFPRERDLFFHVPKEAMQKVAEEPFVLMHPVSRWRFKCPPPHLMAAVIDELRERVVLTGAPSEREYVEEIVGLTKGDVLNLAGKTSLKELGALMLQAKGLITVDSVSLHIGSALKVPTVALFGPTSEVNWGPWRNPSAEVVAREMSCRPCRLDGCGGSKMSDCLWTLSVEEIVQAFRRVSYVSAATRSDSASSLFVLNSLETNDTE